MREVCVEPPPVVVYSAYAAAEPRPLGDVAAVLRKPTSLSEVVEALRSSMRDSQNGRAPQSGSGGGRSSSKVEWPSKTPVIKLSP